HQPPRLGGLGVERGVQHRDEVVGGGEGRGGLFARGLRAAALAGGGGEHVGDAGEAVADLVAERGDQRRLGAGEALGLVQRGGGVRRQLLGLGGQLVGAAQGAVEDQAEHRGERKGAPGDLGDRRRLRPQQERRQRPDHGDRTDREQRGQRRGG